jgi:hypothetical protein
VTNRYRKAELPTITRRGRDNSGKRLARIAEEATSLSSGDMIHVLTARGYRVFPASRVEETSDGWSVVKATKTELNVRGRD